jgi:hypothetical protein
MTKDDLKKNAVGSGSAPLSGLDSIKALTQRQTSNIEHPTPNSQVMPVARVRVSRYHGSETADAGAANGNPNPMPSRKLDRDHLGIYVSG